MADRPADHTNVPLVDLPMYISNGDVLLRCKDSACIRHLRIAFQSADPEVTTDVKRAAHETLSCLASPIQLAYVNKSCLVLATLVFLAAVLAHRGYLFVRGIGFEIIASRGAMIGVLVAIGLVVGPWLPCRGGPAWAVARIASWPTTFVGGRHCRGPDGPRGWPVLGSWRLMQGSAVHRDLAKLAWDGGTSTRELMALSVGATRIVVCSDPEVAKHILRSQVFGDRPLKQAACYLGFTRAIGFAPQGPYWRHLRKIAVTHMFARKQVSARFESLQREASRLVLAIASPNLALATSNSTTRDPRGPGLRLRPYLSNAVVNNITSAVLGRSFGFGPASNSGDAEALEGMIREGFELLGAFNCADHFPLLRHLRFLPVAFRCRSLAARVRLFVQPIIDERRNFLARGDLPGSTTSAPSFSFLDALLSLDGDRKLSDDGMISVLWEMVIRGTDTIAVLIEWALAEVILNPRIQSRIHEELDAVVGQFRPVEGTDIDQLPYLQAVVKETLRAHPPGPLLSWARLASENTQVVGHHVPQGTTVMVNMWAITHDATLWPDPDVFEPSRFMKDVGEGGDGVDVFGTDLRLAPFGSGRRVCPGRGLGVATAQLWLASLLHQFSWSQDPENPIKLTDNLKLSCAMASPLHACAVARIPLDLYRT